jgi:hypothetical protein
MLAPTRDDGFQYNLDVLDVPAVRSWHPGSSHGLAAKKKGYVELYVTL